MVMMVLVVCCGASIFFVLLYFLVLVPEWWVGKNFGVEVEFYCVKDFFLDTEMGIL